MSSKAARAAALAASLAHNRALTDELCGILGNFDARMGRLEAAILPVQARAARAAGRLHARARDATPADAARLFLCRSARGR